MTTLADFEATSIDGHRVDLADHLGSVVLVVNTASKCGFTPQYQGLQELHEQFHDQGLVVMGFPCDQFMHQEPGSEAEIAEFCSVNFGVDFPMFSKIEVNGEGAHPLYRWLTGPHEGIPAEDIGWNFTKFLIGRDGTVRARYASDVEPAALIDPLAAALSDNA
ncbi:MAG TPA: glutathione peroxidase [Candidatus Brachybacterium merdavium]|uniref:Glutathione peroxidase n=1 Tax=Candidatus Brachybacterium merdavium TaxID=2838513 RepID=A0A9D2LEH4_9MICO|nr:glutathione peroxidase [Candidatus Brachybacterium merdavium]